MDTGDTDLAATLLATQKQSPIDARALVERYLCRVGDGNADEVAALFTADARLEDPAGSGTVHVGRPAIAEFYRAIVGSEIETQLLEIRTGGLEAVFSFVITVTAGESRVSVRPMEVMTFNAMSQIVSMKAYWSHENVSDG